MSELHLYEGTEFEDARDAELARLTRARVQSRQTPEAARLTWFRRATALFLLRKSYSRA